ncbi:hypothetical protein GH733_015928 [Mirounga leonina]|nr:hypothetical protein GH733_015928 [Mirounga leonina]
MAAPRGCLRRPPTPLRTCALLLREAPGPPPGPLPSPCCPHPQAEPSSERPLASRPVALARAPRPAGSALFRAPAPPTLLPRLAGPQARPAWGALASALPGCRGPAGGGVGAGGAGRVVGPGASCVVSPCTQAPPRRARPWSGAR